MLNTHLRQTKSKLKAWHARHLFLSEVTHCARFDLTTSHSVYQRNPILNHTTRRPKWQKTTDITFLHATFLKSIIGADNDSITAVRLKRYFLEPLWQTIQLCCGSLSLLSLSNRQRGKNKALRFCKFSALELRKPSSTCYSILPPTGDSLINMWNSLRYEPLLRFALIW